MARIVDHLPIAELEARYRAARDVTEARHYQAIWLLAQGRTVLEVGEVMAFAPRWVEELAARYNAHGPEALGDQRRRNGRAASLLREEVLAALAERLRTPPEDGGLWIGPKVAAWMARQLGLERVHPQRGWEALKRIDWSLSGAATAASAGGNARAEGGLPGGLDADVAAARAAHPDRPIEVWAEDEHRLGLKPIRRRVWAPKGQRPIALGHRRYQWLHVAAFVQPTSGEAVWYLCSGLSKPFFAELLATFARETGTGRDRSIILVLDNAGWHGPEGLAIPDGISLVFLPPYSPELQPAEHLWPLVDEPIANRHLVSLDELSTTSAERCRQFDAAFLRPHTDFHWWPRPVQPS
jgi:hypothetical protein